MEAQKRGANQIELCSRLDLDGLTPIIGDIEQCLDQLNIHLKVMIRPIAGHFILSNATKELMLQEIDVMKEVGVKEVVFGATTEEARLNIDHISIFRDRAFPMKVCIHKAIDTCSDLLYETDELIRIGGIKSILTSGGSDTAKQGAMIIKEMIVLCQDEIQVIPAGRITNHNLLEIDQTIGASIYHGRKILGSLV